MVNSCEILFGKSTKFIVILLLSAFIAFILQPRIGVRDKDAYNHIVGAYSIQAGKGYCDLSGNPLNHWPPGYSLLLSLFPWPLQAALLLNYLALGAATGLIYLLARNSGKWSEVAALGLALAVGFIFLRRIATNAAADVLTYALFLLGVFLHYKGNPRFRIISYIIWGMLIPLKLIAVVFIPAAVLARYLGKPMQFIWAERYEIVSALACWSIFLVMILIYNALAVQALIPSTHEEPSYRSVTAIPAQFFKSIPRIFLSNWYGSLGHASALIPFCVVLLVALVCLSGLRLYSRELVKHAALLIIISGSLQFVRQITTDVRLTGYGLILLLLAFSPAGKMYKIWALYGLLGIGLTSLNAFTHNSLGTNDARYEQLAHEFPKMDLSGSKILTNSYHILDIHSRIATQFVYNSRPQSDADYYFWVYLPAYDAIATTVVPVEMPSVGWCEVASMTGAKLFRKCSEGQ